LQQGRKGILGRRLPGSYRELEAADPMTQKQSPAEESSAVEHARRVLDEGYTILPELLDQALVATLRDTVAALLEDLEIPYGTNEFLGLRTRRIFNLLARDPVFAQLPIHDALLPIAERVLDRECLLSSLTAIHMEPGETDQPIHADDGSVPLPKPHVPTACIATVALTDFSADNGGTRIVPGSQHRDRSPRRGDLHQPLPVEMSAGSVLVYHGSLWHGGGANRTHSPRTAIVCNYCAGFIRQEECQLLAVPREQLLGFPPRLRQLLGYGTYRGLLGHVDQNDPGALIDPSLESDMVWRRIRH
jgi:ectoine hydroxylase-related dioxygenase (phytanoyl-CoA dioxygenase family)